jgi:DNA-binding CsgD family transcriptional regulator
MGSNFTGRLSAFESVGRGALILDRQGVVLAMNRAVKLGDGLDIAHGRLTATSPAAQKPFSNFLAGLLNFDNDAIAPKSTMFALPRLSGARPLVVDGITQPTALQSLHSSAVVLLLLTDLDQMALPPMRLLSDLFELTRTEAELAIQLCSGKSLRNAADELSITEGYARQRLKSILQKTRTSRQAELMILLSKLARF